MLQLTENAVVTLDEARRQQNIPGDYGIRISGVTTPDGQLGVEVGFAPAPAASDAVAEQHGTAVYVAAEVVEPLANVELDVSVVVTNNGASPTRLVLRPQGTGHES